MTYGDTPPELPLLRGKHVICDGWYIINDNNNIWHTGDNRMLEKNIQAINNAWVTPIEGQMP